MLITLSENCGLDFQKNEVVFCDELPALDLDRILPSKQIYLNGIDWNPNPAQTAHFKSHRISKSKFHRCRTRDSCVRGLFLSEHRMGAVPILPAVAGLEMMLETLSLTPGDWTLADVKIEHPLAVKEGTSASVRVILEGENLRVVASARKPDGVMLEPERVHLERNVLRERALHITRFLYSWGNLVPFHTLLKSTETRFKTYVSRRRFPLLRRCYRK